VTGRRGCLGRLLLLFLITWPIGELAQLSGWSDATTGTLFLLVLALLAIRGSGRGRVSGTAPVTKVALAPSGVRDHHGATAATRRLDRSPRPRSPRRPRTAAQEPIHRARDPLPAGLRFRILARDGFRCRYCGRAGNEPGVVLHVDHVVPVVAGGTTSEGNLLTACAACNLGKGARAVVPVGP
jgi:5-methylcytosine-specific restriction endonuclease McrA